MTMICLEHIWNPAGMWQVTKDQQPLLVQSLNHAYCAQCFSDKQEGSIPLRLALW